MSDAASLHRRDADRFVTLSMMSPLVRSLNPSTTVGIAVYEVMRPRRDAAP